MFGPTAAVVLALANAPKRPAPIQTCYTAPRVYGDHSERDFYRARQCDPGDEPLITTIEPGGDYFPGPVLVTVRKKDGSIVARFKIPSDAPLQDAWEWAFDAKE